MNAPREKPNVLPARPRFEPLGPTGLAVHAPAKINLDLLVLGQRPDGYHEIDSLVAKVTLYDRIELRPRDDGAVRLICEGLACGQTEENLAVLAARALGQGRDVGGVDIVLAKHIPPGRGLGGGSSDAAAVLAGLNELWQLDLKEGQLLALAAELGSDVPLFLGPPALRMTGRGEGLESVQVHDFAAVLVLPPLACRTSEVYAAQEAAAPVRQRPFPLEVLAQVPSQWRGQLVNQLEEAAASVCPGVKEAKDKLSAACGLPVCMTGSGSGLFILYDDPAQATAAVAAMPDAFRACSLVVRANPW